MHHQHTARIKVAQQILSTSTRRNDSNSAQTVDDCFTTLTTHGSFSKHLDSIDASPDRTTLDAPANGFYLW